MNLNQLTYFITTAKHQLFTRAADELFISQPSLSHAIASLETELGTQLFEKRGRNVVLTRDGQLFLKHAKRALAEIETGCAEISRLTHSGPGYISIGYPEPMDAHMLSPVAAEFLQDERNAGMAFHFSHTHAEGLISGLKSQRFDLVLFPAPLEDPEILFMPLFSLKLHVIAAPQHPLCAEQKISFEQLREYPFIRYRPTIADADIPHRPQERRFNRLFEMTRLSELENVVCETDDVSLLYSMVAQNLGISLGIPSAELSAYPVQTIPFAEPEGEFTIGIAHLKDRFLPSTVERFIHHLQNNIHP